MSAGVSLSSTVKRRPATPVMRLATAEEASGPISREIGAVRADRDLLEAIVFPSASFVRSFEPIAVATKDGKVFNGLLRGETADELILATGVNQEARISRGDIEEMRPGTVSVMPAGLDQQLSPQELADLVAFLKACK